jgi:predicted DNA-binding ribbon-helix-helix protein
MSESRHAKSEQPQLRVVRVQTGVRIEKRMLKVLKALAEYFDISLGDLLEGIVLHAFEGKSAFDQEALQRIAALREIYGMDYDASASHHLLEEES